jgi:hypothetical protein
MAACTIREMRSVSHGKYNFSNLDSHEIDQVMNQQSNINHLVKISPLFRRKLNIKEHPSTSLLHHPFG